MLGFDFGSDSVQTPVATQAAMAGRFEHIYQPGSNAVAHSEAPYLRHPAWAEKAEPLYTPV